MNQRRITCVLCPNGCELDVVWQGDPSAETVTVDGARCPKGENYALEELVHPRRTLTTSVRVTGGDGPLVSVKTVKPIPRGCLMKARHQLRSVVLAAPVRIGDEVLDEVAGTGVRVVVTRGVVRRGAGTAR